MPINLWVVLHPPQDPFGLSGVALLADLLTKAALVYGAVLGVAATMAINQFQIRARLSRTPGSWCRPRDIALALVAPLRLFSELRTQRGLMLGSPHLGSALLAAAAVGIGDAYARIKGVSSVLPALYQVIPTGDTPGLAPQSDWVLVLVQMGTALLIMALSGLVLWWLSRALRGSATLGQLTVAAGLSFSPLLLFYTAAAVGAEPGRWDRYVGLGTAGWSVALCALAMVALNPQLPSWRRAAGAGLALMTVVTVGLVARTEAYQRGLAVNYLRWLVWVAPRGQAEAHARYDLALAKVTSEGQRRRDLSAAIPDLLGIARDYPNSLSAARSLDTMSLHHISQGELHQAETCAYALLGISDSPRYDARTWHGKALLRLGSIEYQRGNLATATGYWQEVAMRHPELRDEAMHSLEMVASVGHGE
jgi:hypothetical protein